MRLQGSHDGLGAPAQSRARLAGVQSCHLCGCPPDHGCPGAKGTFSGLSRLLRASLVAPAAQVDELHSYFRERPSQANHALDPFGKGGIGTRLFGVHFCRRAPDTVRFDECLSARLSEDHQGNGYPHHSRLPWGRLGKRFQSRHPRPLSQSSSAAPLPHWLALWQTLALKHSDP